MTINKSTILELEEQELYYEWKDGYISEKEYKRRLAQLKKNYSRHPIKEKDYESDL